MNPRQQIPRLEKKDISREGGLVCDLLWSDPNSTSYGFEENIKGAGYSYGSDVLSHFLVSNNFDMIVRSHEVLEEGYDFKFNKRVLSIFSIPDFLGKFGNSAIAMLFTE